MEALAQMGSWVTAITPGRKPDTSLVQSSLLLETETQTLLQCGCSGRGQVPLSCMTGVFVTAARRCKGSSLKILLVTEPESEAGAHSCQNKSLLMIPKHYGSMMLREASCPRSSQDSPEKPQSCHDNKQGIPPSCHKYSVFILHCTNTSWLPFNPCKGDSSFIRLTYGSGKLRHRGYVACKLAAEPESGVQASQV